MIGAGRGRLIGFALGLLLAAQAVTPVAAQKSITAPPAALEALLACASWRPDTPPDSTVATPTGAQATFIAEGRSRRVQITWRDEADNEACYGILQTAVSPPLRPSDTPIIITLPDRTEVTTLPPPGRACYRIYAGTATGHSALSDEACVEVPPPPPPASDTQDPCDESSVQATRATITAVTNLVPQRVRQLTDEVTGVALRLPHSPDPHVLLWHEATGTQVILATDGTEFSRANCDPAGEQAISVVLNDPERLAQALALAQEVPPLR